MPDPPKTICRRCRSIRGENGCKCGRPGQARQLRRGSSSERGYDYAWQKLRAELLGLDGGSGRLEFLFCADCQAEDVATPVEELHHIKKIATHPHLRLDPRNLMPLCKDHHNARTARGE